MEREEEEEEEEEEDDDEEEEDDGSRRRRRRTLVRKRCLCPHGKYGERCALGESSCVSQKKELQCAT